MLPVETEFVGVSEPAAMPTRRAISFGPFRVLPAQQLLVIRPFVAAVVPWRSRSRWSSVRASWSARASFWPAPGPTPSSRKATSKSRSPGCAGRWVAGAAAIGIWARSPGEATALSPVTLTEEESILSAPQPTREKPAHNLPARITRPVGRVDVITHVAAQLPGQRRLTIVGPGGIGKTAIANRLVGSYEHGVWLVDLPSLIDPRLVPTALAVTLELLADDPLSALIAAPRDK